MIHKISVVIEKDEYGYYAYCPKLKGCQTQGETLEAVKANIQEAVELYLETLSEEEKREEPGDYDNDPGGQSCLSCLA